MSSRELFISSPPSICANASDYVRSLLCAGLPHWPFCGQISEIWPYFKLVGGTTFGLDVWLFFGRFLKIVWPKIFSVGRFSKYVYFKAKLSMTTTFLEVSSPA